MTAEGREGGLEPGGSTEALFCGAAGKLGNNLASKVFVHRAETQTQVKSYSGWDLRMVRMLSKLRDAQGHSYLGCLGEHT